MYLKMLTYVWGEAFLFFHIVYRVIFAVRNR